MKLKDILAVWIGLAAMIVIGLSWHGGRPSANWHPVLRHGGEDWY